MEAIIAELATRMNELGRMHTSSLEQNRQMHSNFADAIHSLARDRSLPIQGPAPATQDHAVTNLMKSIKLSDFHGERDSEELDTWLFAMDEYFSLSLTLNGNDALRMSAAGLHMKDQAAT